MSIDITKVDKEIVNFSDKWRVFIGSMEEESNLFIMRQLIRQNSKRLLRKMYNIDYDNLSDNQKDIFNNIVRRHWEIIELDRL